MQRVFHGIRFKVSNEDWLSVKIAFFLLAYFFKCLLFCIIISEVNYITEIHMKRVFCSKCDAQILFDETKYTEGQIVPLVCPQCAKQFKVKIGHRVVKNKQGEEKEQKELDFSHGYITVIENRFCYKQEFPLALGNNVIGRRNKDTDGVDIAIVTSDPSMGRKHCVINVKEAKDGTLVYTLRDFPSLTGTFLRNELLGDREQVRVEDGAVITIGATTFILHTKEEQ